jgi:hypothetical protein
VRRFAFCLALACFNTAALAEPPTPPASEARAAAGGTPLPANSLEYQRLMSLGLDEFGRGHWAEARALFLRGHALTPNARSFRALGMTAFNLKRYPEALRELTQALNDPRRPLSTSLRRPTRELLDRADTFVGVYQLRIEPPQAELRVDGVTVAREGDGTVLLSVGEHLLELYAPGHEPLHRPLLVDGTDGEHLRLTLHPLSVTVSAAQLRVVERASAAPPARREPELIAHAPSSAANDSDMLHDYRYSWLLGAGTLMTAAGALGLQLAALAEQRELEADCDGDCDPWDPVTEQRERLRRASIGLWVGSLVLAAGTATMVFFERRKVRERKAALRAAHALNAAP